MNTTYAEQLLKELSKNPRWAEEINEKRKSKSFESILEAQLATLDEALEAMASRYFDGHPGEAEAPYVVCLVLNRKTQRYDFEIAVGSIAITYLSERALAQVISGRVSNGDS